jgi:hypothetical protein
MFFRESNPRRFRPNFGIYGLEDSLFIPDGIFIYCPLSNSQLTTFRPVDTVNGTFIYCTISTAELTTFRSVDTVNGTFVYCAFDLTNSGFDRNP